MIVIIMRREKKQKSFTAWLGIVVVLLVLGGYVFWVTAQPFTSLPAVQTFQPQTITAKTVSLNWPAYGQAAIGAAGYGVLASHGDQTALPTASIAKVVTALAVLQQRPLHLNDTGPLLTINQADVASYNKYVAQNGSVVNVSVGEQISERQALEAMLLPSANNMAETLARWAFGSIAAYNSYANSYVQSLGLKTVTITDPSGFLPTTVASASDLTVLGEAAMQNPLLANIVSEPSAIVPVQGTIYNVNFLIGSGDNVGIKTGNNDQDPGAYLFAFREPVGTTSVLLVGTIMGGPDLSIVMRDAKSLIASASQQFQQVTFVHAGQVVGHYQPKQGTAAQAIAANDISLVTWDGFSFRSSLSLQSLPQATKRGSQVGIVQVVNSNTHAVNSSPVSLQMNLKTPSLSWRLLHPY